MRKAHFIVYLFFLTFYTSVLNAQIQIDFGSSFKYLKGSEVSAIPSNWYVNSYSDNGWRSGVTPFWYGDGVDGTLLTDMQDTYTSIYMRSAFSAANIDRISKMQLSIDYDDGFVLWINGNEKLRVNAPSTLAADATAPELHESGVPDVFNINIDVGDLIEGENLLAIHPFNFSLESSDFHMNIAAAADLDSPAFADSLSVEISHESGFYDAVFNVSLSTDIDTLDIYYTLDGTFPGTSSTAVNIGSSGDVLIDPDNLTGRAATPAVVLRTSLMSTGYQPSFPQARTFIFVDKLLTQSYPGGDWPDYDVNEQIIDLGVDTDITQGSTYGSRMDFAFKSIPSLSIITDNASLFDASQGIYVNAWGHGEVWEKECSVELFNEDSSDFFTNAGLRIRGGWSRHNTFPKHSFRLFFRSIYGDSKLNFPLFQEEGTDSYDKIDLRTAQNYAWSNGFSRNTMLRELFSRDLQRDLGQPYTRSRFYHLYLNGMYWGVYQTQERSEARYAESYLGGDSEDYDVVKVNTEGWNYRIEATDGNLEKWQEVYSLTKQGFSDMESYYRIQGLDIEGKPSKSLEKFVDIDNLIDYMITIFFTGNFDSPTSSFGNNNGCNNFFAIKDRTNPIQGFQFFNHDAEHSLFSESVNPGIGIYEDRVNLGTRTDNMQMTVNSFEVFHPQWLHYKLSENDEYVVQFSDRVYNCLISGGLLTRAVSLARFDLRMQELDPAIISESARWGDAKSDQSYTRDEHWLREVNKVRNDFFSRRPDIFISQLETAGLYPSIEGVDLYVDQKYIASEEISFNESAILKVNESVANGEIVYTLDGKDPRLKGGEVRPSAIHEESSFNLQISHSTEVNARILYGNEWSALRTLKMHKEDDDYSGLRLTELHYNPLDSVAGLDTISGKSFEFLEFKNIGLNSISLKGLRLDSAVVFNFPENQMIHPKSFFVIASKPVDFFRRYGMYASGNYKGNLSNAGERIVLLDKYEDKVMSFRYEIFQPWSAYANGIGYSLVSEFASPDGDPGDATYWLASESISGSPFADDEASDNVIVDEVDFTSFSVYPNPSSRYITVESSSEDRYRPLELTIMDINGRLLYRSSIISGERISLSALDLAAGIYFVRIEDGANISNHKVIYLLE